MSDTLSLYCKATSNYPPGLTLTEFRTLGEEWTGESCLLPFGEGAQRKTLEVVGWTDLFMGRPCPVHVVKAQAPQGEVGYLVYGGNSGVRVLDEATEVEEWESHLPPGQGMPLVWVEDAADLPAEVRAIVG